MRMPTCRLLAPAILLATAFVYDAQAALDTQLVASGFHAPVFVTSPPGDNTRLFVLEQETGQIRMIKNGAIAAKPYLNLGPKVGDGGGEQGLLGLAFHPDYATNGFLYVNYTNNNGDTIIERYKADASRDKARRKSHKLILRVNQPYSNHNGGMIAFGPDGYLYIGMGDGGDANDPQNNAQRLGSLLGKFLRIDVNHGDPYSIPADNPFLNQAGARPEIWSYGWRNPWRWSFDRQTGDLYVGDVGQNAIEELDFQPANSDGGENYGWKIAEGFACRGGAGSCGDDPGFTPPFLDYNHLQGNAIVGGYVYRGSAIAGLAGTYFFADYVRGRIWSLRYNGTSYSEFTERTQQLDPPGSASINSPSSFGQDAAGELYIVDHDDGQIFRIVGTP